MTLNLCGLKFNNLMKNSTHNCDAQEVTFSNSYIKQVSSTTKSNSCNMAGIHITNGEKYLQSTSCNFERYAVQ